MDGIKLFATRPEIAKELFTTGRALGLGTIAHLGQTGVAQLNAIQAARMSPAQSLHEPNGRPLEFGVVRPGLLADLLIVGENPLANLKVLYGTGATRLNTKTGRVEQVGGVRYTIKDGIVYDAKKLLADVAALVER